MKHNILTIGILSTIFGTACTEKIDIDLNEGENNRLVVEGYISTDTMQHSVRLTRSTSYFYNQLATPEEAPPSQSATARATFSRSPSTLQQATISPPPMFSALRAAPIHWISA